MTLYTPVVFTDDPEIQQAARDRHWRYVERHPDNPQVMRLPGVEVMCAIPQRSMSIPRGSLDEASTPIWNYSLNWLARFVHKPMPVVAANDYATELALWAAASRKWPLGALVAGGKPIATQQAISLFTAADGFFAPDDQLRRSFVQDWPSPVRLLPDTPLVDVTRPAKLPATRRAPGVTRVLLAAYYAGPSPTVGVQRINYWFEQIEKLSEGRVTVDLAVATPWPDAPPRVHRVPDLGAANLAKSAPLPAWAQAVFDSAAESPYSLARQAGGLWHWGLQEYFEAREDEYDVVICSGNPYGYFDFAHYAKQRWYARTVLDYRDPFVGNPRLAWTPATKAAAVVTEAGWNMSADVVLAVNDVCASVTIPGGPDSQIEVIPNGFDERSATPVRQGRRAGDPLRLVHAGQLYGVTPPDNLLRALEGENAEFHQLGPAVPEELSANVVNHGRVTRDEVLAQLARMDSGVTFASTSGVETPTKLFDYLAVGLDVLILYSGDRDKSAMHDMLEGVPGIHWIQDEPDQIREWLTTFEPTPAFDSSRSEPFSRRASTLKLIKILEELGDHSFTPEHGLD